MLSHKMPIRRKNVWNVSNAKNMNKNQIIQQKLIQNNFLFEVAQSFYRLKIHPKNNFDQKPNVRKLMNDYSQDQDDLYFGELERHSIQLKTIKYWFMWYFKLYEISTIERASIWQQPKSMRLKNIHTEKLPIIKKS